MQEVRWTIRFFGADPELCFVVVCRKSTRNLTGSYAHPIPQGTLVCSDWSMRGYVIVILTL